MCNFALRMSMPSQYTIPLTGYRDMADEYDYQLADAYFEAIGDSVIGGGDVHAHVGIRRLEGGATLSIRFAGAVTVPCDRCLAPMEIEVSASEELKVVYGDRNEDDGETITIDEREGTIDLANILFELIALQVPLQHSHPEGGCDEQMAGMLRQYIVTD